MITVNRIAFLAIIIILGPLVTAVGRSEKKQEVQWMTPEEMTTRYNETKKPIIVDVYTSWCYYCRVMDNTTWKNDSVTNYLKDHFYSVKIDAEHKNPYEWMGQKFEYISKYKLNELAIKLLQGNMVYPSTVIIPVNGEPEVLPGAFTAKELEMVLKYYGDGWNETTNPEDFQKIFRKMEIIFYRMQPYRIYSHLSIGFS